MTSSADGEQHRRHLDSECPRRLQFDDELEFGRLQHWQVGGQADLLIVTQRRRKIATALDQAADPSASLSVDSRLAW